MTNHTDENNRGHRFATDESLRTERFKVDGELAARSDALQEDADAVLRRARERADLVLRVARARADRASANEDGETHKRIVQERAEDDRVRDAEQSASDATLNAERVARREALAELLAYERRATDGALLNERTRADRVLQRRDDMLAMVSHDLLSLLSSVTLNAAMIVEDERDAGDERSLRTTRRADAVQRATLRMAQLAKSLLDFASIAAGKLHVQCRAADATAVVRELVELFELAVSKKGLKLIAEIGSEPLHGLFDPDRLLEVLTNLLTNAVKFSSPPGVVSITLTRVGTELEFLVSDTGCGIPADEVATIFDPFTRAHGARAAGHGLGLYISQQLVVAQGGQLTVDSEVGRGSTFKFRIPAAQAHCS